MQRFGYFLSPLGTTISFALNVKSRDSHTRVTASDRLTIEAEFDDANSLMYSDDGWLQEVLQHHELGTVLGHLTVIYEDNGHWFRAPLVVELDENEQYVLTVAYDRAANHQPSGIVLRPVYPRPINYILDFTL